MATRDETGWQSEKTLAECMQYMLDNEIATDVCFEVESPDGTVVNIRAHKYMLIARSPVFEAMFASGMAKWRRRKDEKIRIDDINADNFRALLRFMYCDNAYISPEMAPSLMYAAKKYMLPKLLKECTKLLQISIKVENVCFLLDQSLLFSEETLRDDCLEFISNNSDKVLKREELLDSSDQAMDAILKIEKMRSSESVVYQNCVNWAKHQLRIHKSTENPTDEQIRETLGSLLYDIRFPTMNPTDFANLVGNGNVLTAEEKSDVYFYFITKQNTGSLRFKTNERLRVEKMVDRAITVKKGIWYYGPVREGIDFTVDTDIHLSGLGLFTGTDGNQYDVDIEVLPHYKKRFTIPFTGNSTPFRISFDSPIPIRAGITYTIIAFAQDNIGYYGEPCQAICKCDDVTFTFSRYAETVTRNDETRGQIPQLYFLK